MTRNTYIRSSAAAAVMIACVAAAGATEITLRERTVSTSSVVRLGDVAEVVTADVGEQRRLAGLLLMPAPAPGTQQFLRQREVQDVLAAHGEDLSQLRFGGANQIAIVSPDAQKETVAGAVDNRTIDRQAVLLAGQMKVSKAAVTSDLRRNAEPLDETEAERVRAQLDKLIVDYLAAKAGRKDAWRVKCNVADRFLITLRSATTAPKCSGGAEPWTGPQRFVISFSTAKGAVQLPVFADIALAMPVVIAIRPIERGAVFTAAHVEMQTVDFVPSAAGRRVPVESLEKLIGLEARQAIKLGETVYTDQVQAPLLVKRGEEITVMTQGGGIRVRTMARAKQDGARGELVQVETLDGKDRYDARVVGTREAAVFAGARQEDLRPTIERTDTAWRHGK